jgi:hypothetical protein
MWETRVALYRMALLRLAAKAAFYRMALLRILLGTFFSECRSSIRVE